MAELRRVEKFLMGKEPQPQAWRARSTLTPTLSRKREREKEGEREPAGSLSRVLVGEGWGEGDPPTRRPAERCCQEKCSPLCATPQTPPLCGEVLSRLGHCETWITLRTTG